MNGLIIRGDYQTSTLLKILFPYAVSLPKTKKLSIACTADDYKYYTRYLQHIKMCETVTAFLEDKNHLNIKALNKRLDKIPNKPNSIDNNFNKIHEMHIALKTGRNLEFYKQQLPPHPLDSFDSFNVYRVMRQSFYLCIDFLYTGNKLLHPAQKPKLPKKTKKIETTTAPTSELSIETVAEQKEYTEGLVDLEQPASLNDSVVTQSTELQEKVSQCVLAFPVPMQEQKNDTPMLLIESPKIHSVLQFIAELDSTESATLLSWTQKAPHMQVGINELERTIKKLNGKIDMSSGGSHHRIIFKNSIAFVDAFDQGSTKGTERTAKGTLVKQHGKGKSSRLLPSYAIKTFMQTLQKMGVTETILRIYTSVHSRCKTFKNPQDKTTLLTNAQNALVRNQSKMLLLLGVYKSKKNQKGHYPALRKLHPERSSRKDVTNKLMDTVFSFLWPKKPK